MSKPKNENDQKILKLQKQVEEKRAALVKAQKFSPITNCSIQFDGERFNINALDIDSCTLLTVKVNALKMSSKDLAIEDSVKISGYSIDEWLTDLKAKLAFLNRKKEEDKLKKMESKLKELLSNDTKIEMELENLEKELLD
jgi:hypothetical protein